MAFLFLYCRAGFESECAAEIQQHANNLNIYGYCRTEDRAGYVTYYPHEVDKADDLACQLSFQNLIFCRQWFVAWGELKQLPVQDRVSAILAFLKEREVGLFHRIILEHLDTNEGKALSALCRSIRAPLEKAINANFSDDAIHPNSDMHLCFISSNHVIIGAVNVNNSSPWAMGIPRLKFPTAAPSRSTLKLDEAFLTFQVENDSLRSGMRAADLGAAPGGWTWQLVKRNLLVTAIDNGPMQKELLESGLVEHLQEDAFKYHPKKSFHWMVCDIVDKPARVTDLIITWLVNGWCENTIFNLKLPMKKRYLEVQKNILKIEQALQETGLNFKLQVKQLYHDREEVTVMIAIQ